ncbi:hypothetical protein GCM10027062_45280 [Nocardioides hungaricus]
MARSRTISAGFLTTKKLQRSAHNGVKALVADIRGWVEQWNEDPKLFVWHESAEEMLDRLAAYGVASNKMACASA